LQDEAESVQTEVTEAVGVVAVLGIILALPKLTEILVKSLVKITATFKKFFKKNAAKSESEQIEVAKNIIAFTHKWHKMYVKVLYLALKTAGVFKKANITNPDMQMKATEAIYYTLVAGLAIYSGVGAVSAFKAALTSSVEAGHFSLGALESAMSAIKSKEVTEFLQKIHLI